jgi:glycosyltransferase involved in cell wall biosynthesis
MSLSLILVFPAPPHPAARNTAARYYAALLRGLNQVGISARALAIDDGTGAAAAEWTDELRGVSLESFTPDVIRRDVVTRGRRLVRPMWDATPARLRHRLAHQLADGYDVLHVEEFHLGALTADRPRSLLSILHSEARDALAQDDDTGVRTVLQRARGLRAERILLRGQRYLRTISRELEQDIRATGATAPISVIPLALEVSEYAFRPDGRPPVAGLIGSMTWPPTRRAAIRLLRDIWPRVLAAQPEAELLIAGWAANTLQADTTVPHGVTVLSDLPDHREFFDRIGLLVFPIDVGSGMKVKVLESAAVGVPVVSTPIGVEGLEPSVEPTWWEADGSQSFANTIVAALRDPAEREARARRARALLEKQCAPTVVASKLVAEYRRIAAA